MNLVLEKKHENRIEFTAEGISTGFANMVRRHVVARVPVLAIEAVTFYDNSSPFWDEYIAHRLGLMPIITPDKTPASAEITFSLDATGPKVLHASDMKSSDKDIQVAKENIVIVTLGENQALRFEGKAVLGTAIKHAKYQAGLMGYGETDGGKLKFFIESFYQMPPDEVLERACDAIESSIGDAVSALTGEPKKAKKEKKEKKAKAEKKAPAKKKAKKAAEGKEEKEEKEEAEE